MTRDALMKLLVPYALDELDPETTQAVRQLVDVDEALGEEVHLLRKTVALLSNTLAQAPVPNRLSEDRKQRIFAAGKQIPDGMATRSAFAARPAPGAPRQPESVWAWLTTPRKGLGLLAAAALLLIIVTLAGLLLPGISASRERAPMTQNWAGTMAHYYAEDTAEGEGPEAAAEKPDDQELRLGETITHVDGGEPAAGKGQAWNRRPAQPSARSRRVTVNSTTASPDAEFDYSEMPKDEPAVGAAEEMVELRTRLPAPGFVGTPAKSKSADLELSRRQHGDFGTIAEGRSKSAETVPAAGLSPPPPAKPQPRGEQPANEPRTFFRHIAPINQDRYEAGAVSVSGSDRGAATIPGSGRADVNGDILETKRSASKGVDMFMDGIDLADAGRGTVAGQRASPEPELKSDLASAVVADAKRGVDELKAIEPASEKAREGGQTSVQFGFEYKLESDLHMAGESAKLGVEILDTANGDRDARGLGITKSLEAQPDSRFQAYGVNPVYATVDQPYSTFSIDVDTASYALARRYMSQGLLPPAEAVRTEEFVNFFDYGYKAPRHRTFQIYADCAPSRFGRGLHLLRIGVKGRRLGREEQRQAVLTFLVDTSGSMDTPDRLGLVQQSLRLLVSRLNPDDRVAIIQYASHARVIVDHTPVSDRKAILAAIDALQCGGSTNLEEGMRRAYQLAAAAFVAGGENRVLLLSDGVANLGTGDAADILQQVQRYRRHGITCSVFGFGMGTYDDKMLETLANKGDGNYTFIDSMEQAQRVFVDDLAATLNTIASDVKIQIEFDPKRVKRYRQLGYENRQLAKEDFRNDAVDAGEVGSGQSVTALYELELSHASSRAPLCVVRVRYRRVDTGAVAEIERPVGPSDMTERFDAAGSHFKLAACVAEFAEVLRGSPYAVGSEYEDVAMILRPVALELTLDQNVQELLRLVQGAGGMSRGQ